MSRETQASMPLTPGTRFGPYEIVAPLGAGGMGEVYRARDTRLGRTVAIKVLSEMLAGDPQLRQRFDLEARALSQLAHPHICTLYDVGDHAGTAYLVMEFLEGETLEERLARGGAQRRALALDEALRIAIEIADALSVAHRHGIVHRDLKPGNVMLTATGAKLLDFGLAKTAAPAVVASALSMMPTTPPQAPTAQGTILGTFHYMAPEQVEGAEADSRTDIFAFGCVLYEMLTGQKAFEAKTHASLIAAILEREPQPVAAVQPLASRLVDAIVRRCLAKKPDDRWQSAADLGIALRWAAEGMPTTSGAVNTKPASAPRRVVRGLAVASLVLGLFAAGVFVAWRYMTSATLPPAVVRFEILPPPDANWSPAPIASTAQLALSPDGHRLAVVAAKRRGISQIWIRPLEGVQAQALAGTEGASFPFWSPDGRSIAFFAGGKLKKIDTSGGIAHVLCDAPSGRGGSWSPEGVIVFSAAPTTGLLRVSAAGGAVTPATALDRDQGAITHYWPQFLPDGRRFLYYQRSTKPEHQGVYAQALESPIATRVLNTDSMAVYARGHLLFMRDGILFAQPFDEPSLKSSGEPTRVADGVGFFGGTVGYFAVTASPNGALVHGPNVLLATGLHWRDRTGGSVAIPTTFSSYRSPRLSPDQKSVVLSVVDSRGSNPDIWVLELTRGTMARLTADPRNDWFPTWAPDGRQVFFGSTRSGSTSIFQKLASGVRLEEPLTETAATVGKYPTDVSSDGRLLVFHVNRDGYDVAVVPTEGERKESIFLATRSNEIQGRLSPNRQWMAYASDESGRFEVHVRPFPDASSGQWPISIAGGTQPEWRGDGKELFYISTDGKLMAVPVTTDLASFSAGLPSALFNVDIPEPVAPFPTDYTVTADGQRFLVNTVVDQATRPALTVILNWTSDLKK